MGKTLGRPENEILERRFDSCRPPPYLKSSPSFHLRITSPFGGAWFRIQNQKERK